jgi:excisionase family DNA binding protein
MLQLTRFSKAGGSTQTEEKLGRESGIPESVIRKSLEDVGLQTSGIEKEILTIKEVAEYLKVRPSTIYSWVEHGRIPYNKIGRIIRFRKSEIDRWFDSRETQVVSQRVIAPRRGDGRIDIDRMVEKVIDSEERGEYTHRKQGKPDRSGPRKEVSHGAL